MALIKNRSKHQKIQQSNEDIANLSHAQFKTLVIRMLIELVEYGHKIKEEMKAIQSEIKKNTQGARRNRRKTGLKLIIWNKRKK